MTAMQQSRIPGRAIKMEFTLERATAENAKGLVAQIHRMKLESGIRFFLVDTNAIVLSVIAKATADNGTVLFNISDYYDRLRGAECQPHLLHTIPSHAMLTDALTQFLVFKKWRKVLLLRGAEPDDMVYASAFIRSAKRYGIKITETHEFKHGNDPRQRDKNNVAFLLLILKENLVATFPIKRTPRYLFSARKGCKRQVGIGLGKGMEHLNSINGLKSTQNGACRVQIGLPGRRPNQLSNL